ncbi:hypothetical protein [Mitsuaria sp. GD03876]|uniref:hypothetical protein n=1 Tax=Mitsuaria sp. GD03876 TaxID=2975399 RepID=UPI00244C87C0|nr:hypothetical protein [Mitsuaria sp. GD03876]MDH0865677.1 hypothetical protein [Mitsuaria sp. GD03876]
MGISTLESEPDPEVRSAEITEIPVVDHLDAVASIHRRRRVVRNGQPWDMSHLEPFAFRVDPGLGFDVVVVVYFSSHCFTRSLNWDGRSPSSIPSSELFFDGQDTRVLCEQRHALSLSHLPRLIRDLPRRVIRFARDLPQNFITVEPVDGEGGAAPRHYVVFFDISRDPKRKRRLLLKVQSAYLKESLEPRLIKGRRISLSTLLKAVCMRQRLNS